MRSRYLILLLLSSVLAATADVVASSAEECGGEGQGECANPDVLVEDPTCPSRDLIIRCAGKHLDTNGNGKLDRSELETAIGSLPWYARGILQILGSVDKMVRCKAPSRVSVETAPTARFMSPVAI
jgi:hypothetical protein